MKYWVLLLSLTFAGAGWAEVHRWVDENGRVHFGDSKSAQKAKNAEDISREVSRVNIDASSKHAAEVRAKREALSQAESDLAALEQQKQAQKRAQYLPLCKRLREEIQVIEAGEPVRFLNEDGSEQIVKEKDRGVKLAEWRKTYADLQCDDILASE